MCKKIKISIFKKRVLKHTKKVDRLKQFINYDKAQNVLLLFESDYSEKNLGIQQIIQVMTESGKNVTALGYVNKKEIVTPAYPNYRILHPKDFTFVGIQKMLALLI